MKKETYQEKIQKPKHIDLENKNFRKIYQFYVIDGPSFSDEKKPQNLISVKGVSFKEYGWEGGIKFKQLKERIVKVNADREIEFQTYQEKDLKSQADKRYLPEEYCVFNPRNYKINSLLYYIRNALAHGEFYLIDYSQRNGNKSEKVRMYFLRNHKNDLLKAEMALSEQTLLKWIEIIKSGPIYKAK